VVEGDPQVKTRLCVVVRVHGNAKHLVGQAHFIAIRTVPQVDLQLPHKNALVWSVDRHCDLIAYVIVQVSLHCPDHFPAVASANVAAELVGEPYVEGVALVARGVDSDVNACIGGVSFNNPVVNFEDVEDERDSAMGRQAGERVVERRGRFDCVVFWLADAIDIHII